MLFLLMYVAYAMVLLLALSKRGVTTATPLAGGARAVPLPTPTRVLIIGGTGGTGRELIRQALQREHRVTALVRNPARLEMSHPRLTVIRGDVLDQAAVEAAAQGQNAILCALGHGRFSYPTRILSDGMRNLLRAMEKQGVSRIVCETSLGLGSSAGRMGLYYTLFVIPVILPFYFWDKTRQENLIAASPLDWVIVRPVALSNAQGRGNYRKGQDVGSFVQTRSVARADVARFMLDQLVDDSSLHTAVGVAAS